MNVLRSGKRACVTDAITTAYVISIGGATSASATSCFRCATRMSQSRLAYPLRAVLRELGSSVP